MRENKPRVWDKTTQTMHYEITDINWECAVVGILVRIPTAFSGSEIIKHEDLPFENCETMQFTGEVENFKTKKEIYEGDTVRWTSLHVTGEHIGEVTFFQGCWFIQGEYANVQLSDCLSVEVIGNIYEGCTALIRPGDVLRVPVGGSNE